MYTNNNMTRQLFLAFSAILLLLFAGVGSADAQQKKKFSVASFEYDPFDLTAQSDKYKKMSGDGSLYAIIKVTSNNPDDRLSEYLFSFGMLNHKVVEHDDELWLYVQRNAKHVTIQREGYATVSRYDLHTTIQAGRTYVMQLSVVAAPVYTQMVQFAVEPASARAVVMITSSKADAQEELFGNTDDTGGVAKSLPYGSYTYRVLAENYHTVDGRFTLNDRTETLVEHVRLRPNFSEVTLQVDADADIYVNGEKKGQRSWKGILKAGNYQVECQQTNHRNSQQYITVEENNNRTFTLTPPTPITGTLAVTSKPLGAAITIDGKDYGKTPRNIVDMLIGQRRVTLTKEGYEPAMQLFELKENETTEAQLVLTKATTTDEKAKQEKQPKPQKVKAEKQSAEPSGRLKSSNAYVSAVFQAGSLMAAGATVGAYLSGFNVEASYLFGLAKSEDVTWYSSSATSTYVLTYKPTVISAKLGYGIHAGSSFRLTPQVGVSVVSVKSDDGSSKGNATAGCAGVKAEYALARSVSIYAAPEMSFALQKSDIFGQLADVSSKIKGWGTGFNVRLGLSVNF